MQYRYIIICMFSIISLGVTAQTDRECIRHGNKLFHAQSYDKSEVEYRKAISKNPRNAQAVYNLGNSLLAQQKDSAAVVEFEKAGKMETIKVRKAMCYHNIGVICQKGQLYGEAIEAYKEALRNNPADEQTRYNLALCKKLQKNQPQQNKNNKNKDKNKKDKNKNKDKDKDKNKNKDKDKDKQKNKQPQPKDKMSKENAEQLLNAAMQEEKATQQRLKKAMQQQSSRRLQKNW